jgi:hypothetical protein
VRKEALGIALEHKPILVDLSNYRGWALNGPWPGRSTLDQVPHVGGRG